VGEKFILCLILVCIQGSIENRLEVGGRGSRWEYLGHRLSLKDAITVGGECVALIGSAVLGVCACLPVGAQLKVYFMASLHPLSRSITTLSLEF